MKKKVAITILFIAVLAVGFLVYYKNLPVKDNSSNNSILPMTIQKWETKIDDQAGVNIAVTPIDVSPKSSEWKFDVGMNTHSVELDQDMTQSAVLVGGDNKEYKPTKWEGPTGGHHREGILSFISIAPYPQHLTLKIKGVGDVDRTFSWTLN